MPGSFQSQKLSSACESAAGDLRVLAQAQVLEGQKAAGVERHQHLRTLYDVQTEGPGANNQPLLSCRSQGEHHAIIVLRHKRQTIDIVENRKRQKL